MAGTRRIPLARRPQTQITPLAVKLFAKMGRCSYNSDEWWLLQNELHSELGLMPHQWPAVLHPSEISDCEDEDIVARMALLAEAVRAHRMNGVRT